LTRLSAYNTVQRVDDGRRARFGLAELVVGEVIAVVGLHRLGSIDGFAIPRRDFGRWLRDTPSEDVLLAGIRTAALAVAWWLLATTLIYVAARVTHRHGAARAIGWATLPAVRRWADRAAAASIVTASVLGAARPATADPPPSTAPVAPPVVIDLDHRDRPGLPDEVPSSVRTGRAPEAPPAPTSPPSAPVPFTPPSAPAIETTHVVSPGEHLWSIAAAHLGAVTAVDIAPYWRRVVEHNQPRLRSGDPNLVYPGEVIELPPG
jgi:nucleoid-associated protein YgaU